MKRSLLLDQYQQVDLVSFYGAEQDTEEANAFAHLPPFKRVFIILCGPIGVLILSCLLVGTHAAGVQFAPGFMQVVRGALEPRSYGQHAIASVAHLSTSVGFGDLLGKLATKIAAYNLFPLPQLAGGEAALALVQS